MFTSVLAQSATNEVTTSDIIVMVGVVAATAIVTRLIAPLVRAVLTWAARQSAAGRANRWHVRTPRVLTETPELAELRRRQRIAATAKGVSRVLSALLWTLAFVLILERADIDPVFAVSGAGFLGVAIAIGGQHSVNDFLTGLHILLEDRFGEGDQLRLKLNDNDVIATVVSLGAFATRLEDDHATFHVPNRELGSIANLSQRGAPTELTFEPTGEVPAVRSKKSVEALVRSRYARTPGFDASRDGIVVDTIDQKENAYSLTIRTARPLSPSQREVLSRGSQSDSDY